MSQRSHLALVRLTALQVPSRRGGLWRKEPPQSPIPAAFKPYVITFHFLSCAVIVNEKQYCNTSNYTQLLIPQGSLKRKKCIYGCEKLLISAVMAEHGSAAAAGWAPSFQSFVPSGLSKGGPGAAFTRALPRFPSARFLLQSLDPTPCTLAS